MILGNVKRIETNTEKLHNIRSAIDDIQTIGMVIRT